MIDKLGIPNLRTFPNSVYSGATLEGRFADLSALKNAGIQAVVDFREGLQAPLAKDCQKLGLKYIQFPLEHTFSGAAPVKKLNVAKLKEFLATINKGHVYMGCQYGIDRTNLGLAYNYFLNPKVEVAQAPRIMTWPNCPDMKNTINRLVRIVKHSVKRLSVEERASIGLVGTSKNIFEQIFKSKIGQLIAKNIKHIR